MDVLRCPRWRRVCVCGHVRVRQLFFFWATILTAFGCAIPGPPRPSHTPPTDLGCPTLRIVEAANEGLLIDVTLSPATPNGDLPPDHVPTELHILGLTSDDPETLQFRVGMRLDGRLASTAIHGGHVWLTETEWRADAERLRALQAVLVFPDAGDGLADGFAEAAARRCVASEVVRLAPLPDAWPAAVVEPPRVEVLGRVVRVALPEADAAADKSAGEDPMWRIVRRTVKSGDGADGHLLIVPGWNPLLSDDTFVDTQTYPGDVYAYSLVREAAWGEAKLVGVKGPEAYVVMPGMMSGVTP